MNVWYLWSVVKCFERNQQRDLYREEEVFLFILFDAVAIWYTMYFSL